MQVFHITYPSDLSARPDEQKGRYHDIHVHIAEPFGRPDAMPEQQVLAIGDFDGIHLGHVEVIKRMLRSAEELHLPSAIMTFYPHPREVLGQDKYRQVLTPMEDKLASFAALGVDYVYVLSFNERFSQLSPEHFVDQMLLAMGVKSVVVGFDFSFGHKGSGNADSLGYLAKGRFLVEVVRPFHMYEDKVSSTNIREHLQLGSLTLANALLGRPYSFTGTVVRGDGRGRTIGFPTANLSLDGAYVVPARGVYAVRVLYRERWLDGVMNIGIKPTFDQVNESLEVHVLDFDETIYGEKLHVECISYLRGEKKFSSVDELVAQIGHDTITARKLLANYESSFTSM